MKFDIETVWNWLRSVSIFLAVLAINGIFLVVYILISLGLAWYFRHH